MTTAPVPMTAALYLVIDGRMGTETYTFPSTALGWKVAWGMFRNLKSSESVYSGTLFCRGNKFADYCCF